MHAARLSPAFDRFVPGLGARSILVVEDNDLVRDTIARELEDAGYEVIEVATAEEGL